MAKIILKKQRGGSFTVSQGIQMKPVAKEYLPPTAFLPKVEEKPVEKPKLEMDPLGDYHTGANYANVGEPLQALKHYMNSLSPDELKLQGPSIQAAMDRLTDPSLHLAMKNQKAETIRLYDRIKANENSGSLAVDGSDIWIQDMTEGIDPPLRTRKVPMTEYVQNKDKYIPQTWGDWVSWYDIAGSRDLKNRYNHTAGNNYGMSVVRKHLDAALARVGNEEFEGIRKDIIKIIEEEREFMGSHTSGGLTENSRKKASNVDRLNSRMTALLQDPILINSIKAEQLRNVDPYYAEVIGKDVYYDLEKGGKAILKTDDNGVTKIIDKASGIAYSMEDYRAGKTPIGELKKRTDSEIETDLNAATIAYVAKYFGGALDTKEVKTDVTNIGRELNDDGTKKGGGNKDSILTYWADMAIYREGFDIQLSKMGPRGESTFMSVVVNHKDAKDDLKSVITSGESTEIETTSLLGGKKTKEVLNTNSLREQLIKSGPDIIFIDGTKVTDLIPTADLQGKYLLTRSLDKVFWLPRDSSKIKQYSVEFKILSDELEKLHGPHTKLNSEKYAEATAKFTTDWVKKNGMLFPYGAFQMETVNDVSALMEWDAKGEDGKIEKTHPYDSPLWLEGDAPKYNPIDIQIGGVKTLEFMEAFTKNTSGAVTSMPIFIPLENMEWNNANYEKIAHESSKLKEENKARFNQDQVVLTDDGASK